MSAAEESAAWRDWQQQVMQQRMAAAAARERIEDEREEQERRARIEAKRDHAVEAFRAQMTEEPPRTIGAILHDFAAIPDKPWFDPQADQGSEQNPVQLWAGPPKAERSQRESEADRLLARAKAAGDDPYMRRQVEQWHLREIARHSPETYREIVR